MDGFALSPLWGVPFAGLLLSIALAPLLAPSFWHHHYGKVAPAFDGFHRATMPEVLSREGA